MASMPLPVTPMLNPYDDAFVVNAAPDGMCICVCMCVYVCARVCGLLYLRELRVRVCVLCICVCVIEI